MSLLSLAVVRRMAVVCCALALMCGCCWSVPTAVAAPHGQGPDWHHTRGGLYESTYTLVTGPGKYDRLRLHRITREHHGSPRPTRKSVLLVHGDVWGFNAAFMRASSSSRRSLPAYLARRGVDVWGVDLAWTLVPQSVDNLDFMATWGLQHDINDVRRALAFARGVRARTGSGHGALALAAWSRGAWIGYSLLGQESQLPAAKRQAGSFLSLDNFYKTDDENARTAKLPGSRLRRLAACAAQLRGRQHRVRRHRSPRPIRSRRDLAVLRCALHERCRVLERGSSRIPRRTELQPVVPLRRWQVPSRGHELGSRRPTVHPVRGLEPVPGCRQRVRAVAPAGQR